MYDIIYADPSWQYDDAIRGESLAKTQYPVMSIADICNMGKWLLPQVKQDAFLALWTTGPQLEDAFKVIKAWKFTYKTVGIYWTKLNPKSGTRKMGGGHYTRANKEMCLFAKRGKGLTRLNKAVDQDLTTRYRGHSIKPWEARALLEKLYGPDTKKLELFARKDTITLDRHQAPVDSINWDSWQFSGLDYDGENYLEKLN